MSGTKLSISKDVPAEFSAKGFEALEFAEIGDVTNRPPLIEEERELIGLTVPKSELPREVKRGDIETLLIDGKAVEFIAVRVSDDSVFFGEYFE